MKFWRATYMIEGEEETRLIAADKSCAKSKVLRILRETHPEWICLKILRAKKPKGFSLFQR